MKILWVTGWYPNQNAPYEGDFIQRQAHAASLFHDIYVLYVHFSDNNLPNSGEVKINDHLVESRTFFSYKKGIFNQLNLIKRLIYFIQYRKQFKNYLKRFGLPDLIHIHIPLRLSLFGLWIKHQYKIPVVVSEHWGLYDKSVPYNIFHQSFLKKFFLRSFLRSADRIISVSRYLGETMKNFAKINTYAVINNVVDTSLFCQLQNEQNPLKTIVHISNMDEVKNPRGILQVMSLTLQKTNNVRFIIVGAKSDAFEIAAQKMDIDLNHIQFVGEIPYHKVAEYLQKSHGLFMFSIAETFSCVTAEALCCGIPVAAVDNSAFPELINESNGLLSKDFNVNAMTQTLLDIINKEDWDHKKISAEATAKFSYAQIGKEIGLTYEQVTTAFYKKNYPQ